MLTPFGYFDLIDEMAQPGCPVCNLLMRDAQKILNTILYEYVTEPEMHHMFRNSRGLCNEHGWQLTEQGNAMSIAVLYVAVVDEILKELDGKSSQKSVRRLFNKNGNKPLVDALMPKSPCPVCAKRDENEERYIAVFSDHLADAKLMSAYEQSDGVCLDHFKQILNRTSNQDRANALVHIQRKIWTELKYDLSEFVRKYDFNNADEEMGVEGDSWLRSIRQMTGGKGVFGLRRMANRFWKNTDSP